jgi:phosphate:Na+ symporter
MIKRSILVVAVGLLAYALVTRPAFQTVAAGVAIFLFGMLFMEQGFQALTGGVLKKILAQTTGSVAKSQLFGFVATALMQSSSLVTVITISTLTAGLVTLTAGIGIIFGANIGTTTGAWIMAGFGLKVAISKYAMPMIVFGLVFKFLDNKELKGLGNILAGIGFVFLGIHYMKDGFEVFSESFDLSKFAIPGLGGLLVYTLIGMAATVVMQSSHAALMITIAALAAGQVTYDNALALAIGSNVGTTITALLGALGANAPGKRLAWAHVMFNIITGAIAIIFISPLKWCVDGISDFVGIEEDNWTLRLATFHTIFNVLGVAVMTPFIGRMVRLLETRIKEKPVKKEKGVALEPQFLNESALDLPDAALEMLMKETRHLLTNVFEVVTHGLNLHRKDIISSRNLDEIVAASNVIMDIDVTDRYYHSVKTLYSAIVDFATRAPSESKMNKEQMRRVHSFRLVCRDAADVVKTLSQIRPNINRYMQSDNSAMREQYNMMRLNIAGCLRSLFHLNDSVNQDNIMAMLEQMKAEIEKLDAFTNGTIDRLVRDRDITPLMATSLMNDSAAITNIGNGLIHIGRHLKAAAGFDLEPKPLPIES